MPKTPNRERVCKNCEQSYSLDTKGARHKYCSLGCAKRHHHKKWSGPGCRDPLKMKNLRLKREFGICLDVFNKMLKEQGFSCVCCTTSLTGGRETHVDHCHNTGKVRGLLCGPCNQALGLTKESTNTLQNLINYLEEHNES